jgi:hypothetical protein
MKPKTKERGNHRTKEKDREKEEGSEQDFDEDLGIEGLNADSRYCGLESVRRNAPLVTHG